VWGLADRIQNAVDPDEPSFFLSFMHSLFTPAQGILDALAYGLTNTVIRRGCRKIIFPFYEPMAVPHHEIDKNEPQSKFVDYYDSNVHELENDSLLSDQTDDMADMGHPHVAYRAMPLEAERKQSTGEGGHVSDVGV